MSAPWYAHLITGAVAIAAGLALVRLGDVETGAMIVGSGVTFLGVGLGATTTANATQAAGAPATASVK